MLKNFIILDKHHAKNIKRNRFGLQYCLNLSYAVILAVPEICLATAMLLQDQNFTKFQRGFRKMRLTAKVE